MKVEKILRSPMLKLVAVEHPQALVDYKLASNISDEVE